ncbi:unnamed protein product [Cyprideis torosa]|uniref:Uncharacterized protein n=1 Tax=Cyprideis torosa TaxID=163714 RepID=A0A7R8WG10_9CRUS|nr:unnamed protein product [Cyprideis torosa]CAG0892104.1 unnamed protein product [Cyprideis torosa]
MAPSEPTADLRDSSKTRRRRPSTPRRVSLLATGTDRVRVKSSVESRADARSLTPDSRRDDDSNGQDKNEGQKQDPSVDVGAAAEKSLTCQAKRKLSQAPVRQRRGQSEPRRSPVLGQSASKRRAVARPTQPRKTPSAGSGGSTETSASSPVGSSSDDSGISSGEKTTSDSEKEGNKENTCPNQTKTVVQSNPFLNNCFAILDGEYPGLRNALRKRNWCEITITSNYRGEVNLEVLEKMVGLCKCLADVHWFSELPCKQEEFFPRCYIIGSQIDRDPFIEDYILTASFSVVKWVVEAYHPGPLGCGVEEVGGEVTYEVIETALENIGKYLLFVKDCELDNPVVEKDVAGSVPRTWLGNVYKIVHGKAKFMLTTEEEVLGVYNECYAVLEAADPFVPQMKWDGTRNIWIVKPGARSRGRGILVLSSLDDILAFSRPTNMNWPEESRYVVQKYIDRSVLQKPILLKLRIDRTFVMESCDSSHNGRQTMSPSGPSIPTPWRRLLPATVAARHLSAHSCRSALSSAKAPVERRLCQETRKSDDLTSLLCTPKRRRKGTESQDATSKEANRGSKTQVTSWSSSQRMERLAVLATPKRVQKPAKRSRIFSCSNQQVHATKDIVKAMEQCHRWIGGIEDGSSNTFLWYSTGEPINQTFWYGGQPNNFETAGDVVYAVCNFDYEWGDASPTSSNFREFICEVKLNQEY